MQEKHKKPLIVLTGPTAVGKTALSIGLAKAVGGDHLGRFHAGIQRDGYRNCQDHAGGNAGREALSGE